MRIRARLVVAMVLAAAVVAGGTAFERARGTRPLASPAPLQDTSGGWMCPHGGGEGYRAWVVAVNATDRAAEVILTTYGPAEPRTVRDVLPPQTQRYFPVPADRMASASVLEYFGPPVIAGMVATRGKQQGTAAEPCASAAASRWFVPDGTTVRGQAAALVVVNPFAQEAVVDVGLFTEDDVIRHGNLSGVVIPPRRAEAFDLNRFALGEETLLAEVRASLGKVAVAGIGVGTERGLRATLGVSASSSTWILPASKDSDPGRVSVLGTAPRDAPFQVLAQGGEGSKVIVDEEEVAPNSVHSLKVSLPGTGVVVQGTGTVPFVAGRRLAAPSPEPSPEPKAPPGGGKGGGGQADKDGRGKGGKGGGGGKDAGGKDGKKRDEPDPPVPDVASTAGSPRPAAAWVAVSPVPPDGGGSVLVLQNPGGEIARGEVVLIADGGIVGSPTPVEVEPGSVTTLDLDQGSKPVAAVVRLSTGKVVVAQVAGGPEGYAISVGTPVEASITLDGLGI
jgi:hypothetical protein